MRRTATCFWRPRAEFERGGKVDTDWAVYYDLRERAAQNPQAFTDLNLLEFKDRLDAVEFKELVDLKDAIRKGDPEGKLAALRDIDAMTDGAIRSLGIDPYVKAGEKPDQAKTVESIHRFVQDRLIAFQKANGRKAKPEEQQAIVDKAVINATMEKGWPGDTEKLRYEMTIADVPAEERTKIIDALKRQDQPTDDQSIIDLWIARGRKGL